MESERQWERMQAQPRWPLAELRRALPNCPGVYALWRGEEPVYVGKAKSLASRLGKAHRGRGMSMTNSALRRNVAEHLGIATANEIKLGRQVTRAEVHAINAWLDGCTASWLVVSSEQEALALERKLKTERTPPLTKR